MFVQIFVEITPRPLPKTRNGHARQDDTALQQKRSTPVLASAIENNGQVLESVVACSTGWATHAIDGGGVTAAALGTLILSLIRGWAVNAGKMEEG